MAHSSFLKRMAKLRKAESKKDPFKTGESFTTLNNLAAREAEHHALLNNMGFPSEQPLEGARYQRYSEHTSDPDSPDGVDHNKPYWIVNEASEMIYNIPDDDAPSFKGSAKAKSRAKENTMDVKKSGLIKRQVKLMKAKPFVPRGSVQQYQSATASELEGGEIGNVSTAGGGGSTAAAPKMTNKPFPKTTTTSQTSTPINTRSGSEMTDATTYGSAPTPTAKPADSVSSSYVTPPSAIDEGVEPQFAPASSNVDPKAGISTRMGPLPTRPDAADLEGVGTSRLHDTESQSTGLKTSPSALASLTASQIYDPATGDLRTMPASDISSGDSKTYPFQYPDLEEGTTLTEENKRQWISDLPRLEGQGEFFPGESGAEAYTGPEAQITSPRDEYKIGQFQREKARQELRDTGVAAAAGQEDPSFVDPTDPEAALAYEQQLGRMQDTAGVAGAEWRERETAFEDPTTDESTPAQIEARDYQNRLDEFNAAKEDRAARQQQWREDKASEEGGAYPGVGNWAGDMEKSLTKRLIKLQKSQGRMLEKQGPFRNPDRTYDDPANSPPTRVPAGGGRPTDPRVRIPGVKYDERSEARFRGHDFSRGGAGGPEDDFTGPPSKFSKPIDVGAIGSKIKDAYNAPPRAAIRGPKKLLDRGRDIVRRFQNMQKQGLGEIGPTNTGGGSSRPFMAGQRNRARGAASASGVYQAPPMQSANRTTQTSPPKGGMGAGQAGNMQSANRSTSPARRVRAPKPTTGSGQGMGEIGST